MITLKIAVALYLYGYQFLAFQVEPKHVPFKDFDACKEAAATEGSKYVAAVEALQLIVPLPIEGMVGANCYDSDPGTSS